MPREGSTWNSREAGLLGFAAGPGRPWLLALVYAIGYAFGLGGGQKTWIALAQWLGRAGSESLGDATRVVTWAAVAVSVAGAALRLGSGWPWGGGGRELAGRRGLAEAGLVCVAAPLALTLPVLAGGIFVGLAAVLAALGFVAGEAADEGLGPWWALLLRELFPVLAAVSFLLFAPSYDALHLSEAIVVSAGVSLVARAGVPAASLTQKRS